MAALSVTLAFMTAALAQPTARVRGTIMAIDGNILSVKSREGADLKIELAPNATFAYVKALKMSDVAPGTPLGTSAVKGPDGKIVARIVARELHLFPKDRPIPNEGHRPWDLEPGSTMTNATVTAMVESNNGHELTLKYKDGSQQVIVPKDIPIVTAQNGDRSLLVRGQYALIAVNLGADGKMTATRVQVTKDGVKPPQ